MAPIWSLRGPKTVQDGLQDSGAGVLTQRPPLPIDDRHCEARARLWGNRTRGEGKRGWANVAAGVPGRLGAKGAGVPT
eukprot:9501151-Pyramimonas_sp.AAC.1